MKRLIYMDDTMDKLRAYAERKHDAGHIELANGILKAVNYIHNNIVRADAVEVVHGRWLSIEEYSREIGAEIADDPCTGWIYCSECGQPSRSFNNWNYCPECGAKMDREMKNNADRTEL